MGAALSRWEGAEIGRVDVPLIVLELSSGWHFNAKHARGILTLQLKVSHAGIALASSFICVLFDRKFRGRSRIWGPLAYPYVLRCWPLTFATRHCGLV